MISLKNYNSNILQYDEVAYFISCFFGKFNFFFTFGHSNKIIKAIIISILLLFL